MGQKREIAENNEQANAKHWLLIIMNKETVWSTSIHRHCREYVGKRQSRAPVEY
jgi:hypothetical protein